MGGQSTVCLMQQQQPFSYVSGLPSEPIEGNPINALGHSVSFGRFVSDSVSWERWSVFSHNKYVEEAERYAKPGSVAQKKAFFEAHYKRMAAKKAAALLEQQINAASSHETQSGYVDEKVNNTGSEFSDAVLNTRIVSGQELHLEAETSETCFGASNESNPSVEMQKIDNNVDERVDPFVECKVVMEDALVTELANQQKEFTESDPCCTPNMEKPLLKKSVDQKVSGSASKKKLVSYSPKSLGYRKTSSKVSSSPAKHRAVQPWKENLGTPMSRKLGIDYVDKKRATPKKPTSVSMTPVRELNKISMVSRKSENPRIEESSSKTSTDRTTPLKTPTAAFLNGKTKYSSVTPQSESTRTPCAAAESGTTGPKRRSLATDCSKFLSACKSKLQSPSLSTPFRLRTEERSARRKEKLEEKFNNEQTQKVHQQTTVKEKAESELRKLRQTLCFKARPLPEFYKERRKDPMEKLPASATRLGKKPLTTIIHSATVLPSQWPSIQSNGTEQVQGKSCRPMKQAHMLRRIMVRNENRSPNIQQQ